MKRLLAISALLASSAHADTWTGPDKTLHFVGGAAIGASVTLYTGNPRDGLLAGVGVGLAKEVYDSRHKDSHTPSAKDFAVTALGAAVGAYTGLVIRRQFIGYATSF
jgi:uncharacterized protein YfiM (DUF2279 family)